MAEGQVRIYDPAAMNPDLKALVLTCGSALTLLGGCSSGLEGVDKRLSAMQEEISKVQSQNDRLVERVDAMEARQAKTSDAARSSSATHGASERPSLKVVKVVPEDTSGVVAPPLGTPAPGESADDPAPRPLIKLRGGTGKAADKGKGEG